MDETEQYSGVAVIVAETAGPLGLATVKEAAQELAVPVAYLQREVKVGRVPCVRMGNSTRVNVRAVEAALQRQAAGLFADQLYGELPKPTLPDLPDPEATNTE